ncbi:hypothetical protein B4064_3222 [Caldibacillus thermoamylovorans]|uniref:DUF1871 family protein n=1 Tax=Caldibacillus thermoamylovorans TaxID=35841 RepID=UPI0005B6B283|nr:DUF1871 family protein [Caldibacillus thermoamylovorans]KIO63392.1 hypothetical protein B4064_3222 [Caldibacillus thermoamylovorans]
MRNKATDIVTKHINNWDPIYLLAGGAPDDEYEDEIEQIVEAVLKSKDEIEIAEAIRSIFEFSFTMDFDFDKCYIIAKSIWEELYLDEK